MFKKLFFGLIMLVILAVAGATVYLNMIDWNEHKAIIAKQFSEVTGKNVDFKGKVNFTLFPTPSLEAFDIEVYNQGEGQKATLTKIKKLVASLSVNSLLHGHINVEKMVIVGPEIFIEQLEDGKLNWQSSHGNDQNFSINNVEISLNRFMLEDAKVYLFNQKKNFSAVVTDINAEVTAESLFGPYRIEGSFIKNGNPGGFALGLGQFSENFATSVNAVISHPQSESYVRFDGTVLLTNDAINGNVTIESQNPVNFVNSLFKGLDISEDYESPLAMSMAVKTDKKQISLSNVVIKYNGSAGAGNMVIPRIKTKIGDTDEERLRVDVIFNMAEFNPEPVFNLINDFWKKYDGKEYIPELDFDVMTDIKSVKTTYKNQDIRELEASIDFVNNVLTLQNFSARLPFDGNLRIKGEVYSVEKVFTYNFDIDADTSNFAKTAQWLGYDLQPVSNNTYKRSSTKFTFEGTHKTIKIAPFVFNLDKTGINGKLALVRGEKDKYFAIIEADNINFDNYVADMPSEIAEADFATKAEYRFKQLADLNDIDIEYRLNLSSGIWGKIPFEKLYAEGNLKDGNLKINEISLGEIASAEIALRGDVSGFGTAPQVKNLKYGIVVGNNKLFAEKMGLDLPFIDFSSLDRFDSKGVITGGPNRMAVKTKSKLGDIDCVYNGEIRKKDDIYALNGKTDISSDNAVKTLNDFSFDYHPDYPLGLLKISTDIQGTAKDFVLKDMKLNIGSNTFNGNFSYSAKDEISSIKTDLSINKFEFEKFLNTKNLRSDSSGFRKQEEKVPLFAKPMLNRAKFNYDWSKNLKIDAKIVADVISLDSVALQKASWSMNLDNQILKITQFKAEKNGGTIDVDCELNIPDKDKLSGKIKFNNFALEKNQWSGLVYGISSGIFDGEFSFDTQASSVNEMFGSLSGKGSFNISKPTVKGWNMDVIEADFEKRKQAEGLRTMVQQNLGRGDTVFNAITGTLELEKGHFDFNKIIFEGDSYSVTTTAYGNLNDWNMNAVNKLSFANLPNIAGFDFVMDGSISAPSLNADVSAISNMYTENFEKQEARIKAINDARMAKYRALMDVQQDAAQKSYERLQKTVIPYFKSISSKTESDEMKSDYRKIKRRINQTISELKEIIAVNSMTDIDDEVIDDLKHKNSIVERKIATIEKDMHVIHAQDVRIRINYYYDALVEQSMVLPDLATAITEINGVYGKRLAAINTPYRLENDQKAGNMRRKVENYLDEIDAVNQRTAQDNIAAKNVSEVEMLENYAADFRKSYETVTSDIANIKQIIETYKTHLENTISVEEENYKKRKEEEALNQKIRDNTGKIATADGKTVTVERNLEEIKRSEELIRRQGGKVINFSNGGMIIRGGSGSQSKNNTETGTPVIIKINTDDEIESSGRILK